MLPTLNIGESKSDKEYHDRNFDHAGQYEEQFDAPTFLVQRVNLASWG